MEPQSAPDNNQPQYTQYPNGSAQAPAATENPEKSYLVALLLSYFLGAVGAERFYLGKTGTAIAKLVTFGGLGIWQLVDLFLVAFNKLHAKGDNRPLEGYAKNRQWVKILAIVLIIFNIVVIAGLIALMVLLSSESLKENARNTQRKSDLSILAADISQYRTENRSYPSEETFAANVEDLLADSTVLDADDVEYTASPAGCDEDTTVCREVTLATRLENGEMYTVNP